MQTPRTQRLLPLVLLTTFVGLAIGAPGARAEPREPESTPAFLWGSPMAAIAAFVQALELSSWAVAPAELDTSASAAGSYRLVSVPSDEVDRHMILADQQSGLPEMLQGLWWLDGNPLPDEVVSFGTSTWDAARRTTRIHVYGEGIWTWHDSLAGRALYAFVRNRELIYELQFNAALTEVLIVPFVSVAGVHVRVPEQVVKFTSTRISDGVWLRENYVAGVLVETYVFRRIVRANGVREPAFADYVVAAPRRSLIAEQID